MSPKIITPILLAALIVSFRHPALAEDLKPTPIRQQIRQEVKNIRQTGLQEIKEINTAVKTGITDIRADKNASPTAKKSEIAELKSKRISNIYKTIRNQLTQKFDLFTQIKGQVDSRIAQMDTNGKNTTAAKTKLAEFDKYQTAYTNDLQAFDDKYTELTTSTTKQVALVGQLTVAANKVKSDLHSMRQVLTDTLKLLIKNNK